MAHFIRSLQGSEYLIKIVSFCPICKYFTGKVGREKELDDLPIVRFKSSYVNKEPDDLDKIPSINCACCERERAKKAHNF